MGRALKYKYDARILSEDMLSSTNSSPVWKLVTRDLRIIRKGLRSGIGTGRTIDIGQDAWVTSQPLSLVLGNHFPTPLLNCNVATLLLNGDWNRALINAYFPEDISRMITDIPLPTSNRCEDVVFWGLTNDGRFTVNSAYWSLIAPRCDSTTNWRWIWRLKLPQKIKMFIWQVLLERIHTQDLRFRWKIADINIC